MKILNFGSLNIDKTYRLNKIVSPGETVGTLEYLQSEGGKGLNQSIAISRAGNNVYHAGAYGNDGEKLRMLLEAEGVQTDYLKQIEGPSGHAIIQVDELGQNCIIVHKGSNFGIHHAEIDDVLKRFSKNDWLVLQNEISNIDYIVKQAREKGMYIFYNPSPIDDSVSYEIISNVDCIFVNEIEGNALTGKNNSKEIIESLLSQYPSLEIVLTLGEAGAVYANRTIIERVPAYKTEAIDTTGAGDTFTGYFISQRFSGKGIKESLDMASKAAAIAISRKGASSAIPLIGEVSQLNLAANLISN